MQQNLFFGDTAIAVPTVFKITNEKILSDNAGLSSACNFVGDIKGMKTAIHIEWENLKPQQVADINRYILNMQSIVFPMTFLNEEFEQVTKMVQADSPTYEHWGWDKKRRLCRVLSLDLYAYSGAEVTDHV